MALSGIDLLLQRPQGIAHFVLDIPHPRQVRAHALQFGSRPLSALLQQHQTGRLFHQSASCRRTGVEQLLHAPLADDAVHLTAQAHSRAEFLHIEQPAGHSVHDVVRGTVPQQAAGDLHLRISARERPARVLEEQTHLSGARSLVTIRAGKDDILHGFAAEGARALLAQRPQYGISQVALPAAVGAYDHGDPRLEHQLCRPSEGLESP
ncbi:MAG: hypothetical protein BWY79_01587 [Actinobacteria bacterium ADurb.Bin444]|nr:MAG: hypothetical protein BWY79_01587 [Actinobacteria bacterium ADurb.Bin444]